MPLLVKAKRIFTLHDVYFISNKERYSWIKNKYLRWITGLYIKRCDKVLTVSEYSKSEILKYYYKEASGKLDITYNFLEKNNPIRHDCQEFEIKGVNLKRHKYFLYVGSIQPSKNIIRLVEAFKLFFTNHSDYKLIIAGKPTYKGDDILKTIVGQEGVNYLGYVSQQQLELLYSNCLSTCLISLCEGFGIPVLESYSYGRPVIVSNVTSLPEVAGDASIFIEPKDIKSIARGFEQMIKEVDNLVPKINHQIKKFNADESCTTFLNALGIEDVCHKNDLNLSQ